MAIEILSDQFLKVNIRNTTFHCTTLSWLPHGIQSVRLRVETSHDQSWFPSTIFVYVLERQRWIFFACIFITISLWDLRLGFSLFHFLENYIRSLRCTGLLVLHLFFLYFLFLFFLFELVVLLQLSFLDILRVIKRMLIVLPLHWDQHANIDFLLNLFQLISPHFIRFLT